MGNYRTLAATEETYPPPLWTKRQILDGMLYQLKNGCNWWDLPQDLPPYSTVFWHYKQWRSEDVLKTILTTLHQTVFYPTDASTLNQETLGSRSQMNSIGDVRLF